MDLHQLHVFRSAALNGCFTKASEELHVSQSTVSLHVKNLEDQLDCPLFFRTRRHVMLSPAGKLLLENTPRKSWRRPKPPKERFGAQSRIA